MVCPICESEPVREPNKKMDICICLKEHHKGKANAIHSQDLQRLFSIDGRNLRRKISRLRQEGVPICSDEAGYYYADNQQEINNTVCRLNGMVTGVSNARTGLLFAPVFPATVNVDVTIYVKGDECA
jgi:biotin operon repressor